MVCFSRDFLRRCRLAALGAALALPTGCAGLTSPSVTDGAWPADLGLSAVTGAPLAAPGPGQLVVVPGGEGVPLPPPPEAGNDFWIASSRHCHLSDARQGSNGCLDFFRSAEDQFLHPRTYQDFVASARPDRPVCFVIHGSYNSWGDVLHESRLINQWLHRAARGQPLQVVFFTWPSDGFVPFLLPVELAVLGKRSSVHALYLAHLISDLPAGQPVVLMGHSHGARSAASTLHFLAGGMMDGLHLDAPTPPHPVRAVLIAAALDHHWLNPGRRYGLALNAADRVLNVRNSTDLALWLYPLRKPLSHRALGQGGWGARDYEQLGPLAAKVSELNVGPLVGVGHNWSDFYQQDALAEQIVPFVLGADPVR